VSAEAKERAVESSAGALAWTARNEDGKLEVCVWQPSLADCTDDVPEDLECYVVHEVAYEHPRRTAHSPATLEHPLFVALGKLETVFLNSGGLSARGGDRCHEWEVDLVSESDVVGLKRWDENDPRVQHDRRIRLGRRGASWTGGKSTIPIGGEPDEERPSERLTRKSCPEPTKTSEWRTIGTGSYCAFGLGEVRQVTDEVVELENVSIYRSRAACEEAIRPRFASRRPKCGE
jgi:hypothetical protein